mmetsp:Transcript_22633/g.57948  ORF Transcript_22633/g.57948 Transcript_22633/m.57948 type:complete len:528 (+) Transcript_22633:540-2123(+)|eukprot:jgi/Tetstr1/457831/TSEL_044376.t1
MSCKRKRGYSRWTEEEETALRVGIGRYGEGKWKRILCDPELAKFFVDRSNVDLKDKWRTLLCAEKTRPAGSSPCTSDDTVVRESRDHQCGCAETNRSPKPDQWPSAAPLPLGSSCPHPVDSDGNRALASSLQAAKRRHQGTAGRKAALLLQSELMLEVWKMLNSHEAADLLRQHAASDGGDGLGALRHRVTLTSSHEPCTCAEFFAAVMELVRRAKAVKQLSQRQIARLALFETFARRQFEVLSRVDESCSASMRQSVSSGSRDCKTAKPAAPCGAQEGSHVATSAARRTDATKCSRDTPVAEELFAVDVLQMIRGSSPVNEAQCQADGGVAPAALHIGGSNGSSPRATPAACSSAPRAMAAAMAPPCHAMSCTAPVSVPPGCGLMPTAVSAAMDKASELLNNRGGALLPVKDLIKAKHATSPTLPVLGLNLAPRSQAAQAPSMPSCLPMATCFPPRTAPLPLAACSGNLLRPHLPVLQQAEGGLGAPGPGKAPQFLIPMVPAGAESWYPAYMAWVYSAMAHTAGCS